MAKAYNGYSVYVGVGKDLQAEANLYYDMIDTENINVDGSESKCALVYGSMSETPGALARVAFTGLSVA